MADMISNSMEVCRACMQPYVVGVDVNETDIKSGFEELAGIMIKPQDGLPQTVCCGCHKHFTEFLQFRRRVINSNECLLHNLSNLDKTESSESHRRLEVKVEIKKEFNSDCDEPDDDDDDDFQDDSDTPIKTLRTKNNNKTRKKRQKKEAKVRTKRKYINLDPSKIKTLTLSLEEQLNNHHLGKTKPTFTEMAHKCYKCFTGFNYERKLENHMLKCHVVSRPYTCEICQKTFLDSHNINLHKKVHDTRYQCVECAAIFVDKCNALSHYTGVHEGVEHARKCKYCDKVFRYRSTLNNHVKSQHESSERMPCPICNKILRHKDSMDVHLERHKGERNYSCDICDKKFFVKKEVAVHMLSHSNARNYYCGKCDVLFKSQGSLNHHFKTSKNHVESAKHICQSCGKSFYSAFALRIHNLSFHDAGPKEKCPTCGKLVSTAAMKYHASNHKVKSRDHICHECAKSFKSRTTLNRHLLIHTGLKPFSCMECNSSFNQKSTLNTHIRLVHMKLKRKKSESEKRDGGLIADCL